MADRKFVQDKVYLKNTETGVIHEYEKLLEKHPQFVAVVPNPSTAAPEKATKKAAKDFVEEVLDSTNK